MNPGARAAFVACYGRLVTRVWSDPDLERLLERDPRALMAQYGLVRSTLDARDRRHRRRQWREPRARNGRA